MAEQPYIKLNDGCRAPQLGLGVWKTPAEDTARIVTTALDEGYQAVDTAAAYGNEEGVGAAIAGRDVHVTTKLWSTDQGYDSTLTAFEASLKKLGRESIDLYLIHWPSSARGKFVESWKAMTRLKQEGRALSIGVSNFAEEHLQQIINATGVTPAINQIELHPNFQQRELRQVNDRLGIRTESWSPLGQAKTLDNATLTSIGESHGKTTAQVMIRWHLQSGLMVIPKSVHPDRIRQNIDVFDFDLTPDDMAAIEALDRPDGRIGPDPKTTSL